MPEGNVAAKVAALLARSFPFYEGFRGIGFCFFAYLSQKLGAYIS